MHNTQCRKNLTWFSHSIRLAVLLSVLANFFPPIIKIAFSLRYYIHTSILSWVIILFNKFSFLLTRSKSSKQMKRDCLFHCLIKSRETNFAVARYISNFSEKMALHPIEILHSSTISRTIMRQLECTI